MRKDFQHTYLHIDLEVLELIIDIYMSHEEKQEYVAAVCSVNTAQKVIPRSSQLLATRVVQSFPFNQSNFSSNVRILFEVN